MQWPVVLQLRLMSG